MRRGSLSSTSYYLALLQVPFAIVAAVCDLLLQEHDMLLLLKLSNLSAAPEDVVNLSARMSFPLCCCRCPLLMAQPCSTFCHRSAMCCCYPSYQAHCSPSRTTPSRTSTQSSTGMTSSTVCLPMRVGAEHSSLILLAQLHERVCA